MTDPPYLIKDTHAGGHSQLARSIQPINDCLKENDLVSGMNPLVLPELVRVMKRINCYIWCNKAQIPGYLNFFVDGLVKWIRLLLRYDCLVENESAADFPQQISF